MVIGQNCILKVVSSCPVNWEESNKAGMSIVSVGKTVEILNGMNSRGVPDITCGSPGRVRQIPEQGHREVLSSSRGKFTWR